MLTFTKQKKAKNKKNSVFVLPGCWFYGFELRNFWQLLSLYWTTRNTNLYCFLIDGNTFFVDNKDKIVSVTFILTLVLLVYVLHLSFPFVTRGENQKKIFLLKFDTEESDRVYEGKYAKYLMCCSYQLLKRLGNNRWYDDDVLFFTLFSWASQVSYGFFRTLGREHRVSRIFAVHSTSGIHPYSRYR